MKLIPLSERGSGRVLCLLAVPASIAGMALVSALVSPQGKAYTDYTNSVLSLERLRTIDYFAVRSERVAEGLIVYLAPQSTKAIRSQFGSPSSVSEDKDIYLVQGLHDGAIPSQQVVFYYEVNAATGGVPKATSALLTNALLK